MRTSVNLFALPVLLAVLCAFSATSHAQGGGWATNKGQAAFLSNQFPELKGLTSSEDDQKKAMDDCSRQADQRTRTTCIASISWYVKETQAKVDAQAKAEAQGQAQHAADVKAQMQAQEAQGHQAAVAQAQEKAQQAAELQAQRQAQLQEQQRAGAAQAEARRANAAAADAKLEQCQKSSAFVRWYGARSVISLTADIQRYDAEMQQLNAMQPNNIKDMDAKNQRIQQLNGFIADSKYRYAEQASAYRSAGGNENNRRQVSADASVANPCPIQGDVSSAN